MNYEVILFEGEREKSRSNSPTEEAAKKVAKWHCDKSRENSATVLNRETKEKQSFRQSDEEVLDAESGEVLDECPGCLERDKSIAGLHKDLRAVCDTQN